MRTIELVARVTPDSAQALWYELESGFDGSGAKQATCINAAAVQHLSAAAVQVLLVAQKRALRDGTGLQVANPSAEFLQGLRIMGASALIDGGAA